MRAAMVHGKLKKHVACMFMKPNETQQRKRANNELRTFPPPFRSNMGVFALRSFGASVNTMGFRGEFIPICPSWEDQKG